VHELIARGWKFDKPALKKLLKSLAVTTANDLVPIIQQKGVDLHFALDIASNALCNGTYRRGLHG
jgi:hypothetical protein